MSRGIQRYILISLLILLCIPLTLSAIGYWLWGGSIRNSLPAEYMPTAEFLMQNPMTPSTSIRNIDPPPNTVVTRAQTRNICITVVAPISYADDYSQWTYIYLNDQRLSIADRGVSITGGLNFLSTTDMEFCFAPQLQSGFHIIRIEVAKSIDIAFGSGEIFSYTWVYHVEE